MPFANGVAPYKCRPLASLCVAVLAAATLVTAAECDRSPGSYQREGYTVGNIRLKGPLRHFRFVREETLRAGIPLQTQAAFDTTAWSLGTASIQNRLRDPSSLQRFELIVVTAGLENCDAQAKSLDAVYAIFAFGIPAGVSFDSRSAGQMVARTILASGLSRIFANTFPQPLIGYNAARGLYGGTAAHYQSAPGGPIDQADMLITGSGSSLEAEAGLSGSRSRNRGLFRDRDWGFNYRYSDIRSTLDQTEATDDLTGDLPRGPAVQESMGSGRFGVFTRPLGPLATVLRFGTALQGGNGQTDATAPTSLFHETSAVSLKLYAGTTLAAGPYIGRLTYGLQRTQQSAEGAQGFFKHVLDTRHELRFLPMDHRPLSFEVDAGAGWMPNNRVLPVQEAFYGGNFVRPFVTGDPWEVRADPLFRGYPQRSVDDGAGAFGATRFASLNATAAFTVWGRPLVPEEVLADEGFNAAIKGQLTTAESALSGDYITTDAGFAAMAQAVAAVKPDVPAIEERLRRIREGLPAASQPKADAAISSFEDVNAAVESAMEPPVAGASPTVAYRTLALGFGAVGPPTLTVLATDLRELKPMVGTEDASWLEATAKRFEALRESVAVDLKAIEGRAEARARKELAFARRVVDSLLHQVNIVSVSPLAMFDVAKFGWSQGTPSSVRYSAGPGIRLTLVNVNFSVGYSFNIHRVSNAPRGALLFQFSVSDLFR